MGEETRTPSILIPYAGPSEDPRVQDIAIYLRPESNGVRVESTILGVIHNNPNYHKALEIVYLSNLPGDFIVKNRIVEEHYALNIRFAREGKNGFTETMSRLFEERFSASFEESRIVGSFEALELMKKSAEELFQVWVPDEDFAYIHRQSVKKYEGIYIVNYDIPALLRKNSGRTDVFSMILRSVLPYSEFHRLIEEISQALKEEGIITNPIRYSHVFHYSKGPFEQILDGIGYIYAQGETHIELSQLSFFSYLAGRGCREQDILESIRTPIMNFRTEAGETEEMNLFDYTAECSFEEAHKRFQARSPA
jgi:hypothetical protein